MQVRVAGLGRIERDGDGPIRSADLFLGEIRRVRESGAARQDVSDIRDLRVEADAVVFDVEPGRYAFVVADVAR